MQPVRPKIARTVYQISIRLSSTLDLSNWDILGGFDIGKDDFSGTDFQKCQNIGAAASRLGNDGLLVPSARSKGTNLVIFPDQKRLEEYKFEVDGQENISD